jgi:hypothetical protein
MIIFTIQWSLQNRVAGVGAIANNAIIKAFDCSLHLPLFFIYITTLPIGGRHFRTASNNNINNTKKITT